MSKLRIPPEKMSREEVFELAVRSSHGDTRAREQLILSHMYIIDYFVYQYRGCGVDDEDLYQDGCYGLIQAVDHYDPRRGILLASYASHWILKYIKKALTKQNKTTPIVPTEESYLRVKHYTAALDYLKEELGRTPTDLELSIELDIPISELRMVRTCLYTYLPYDGIDGINQASWKNPWHSKHLIPNNKLSPSAEDEALSKMSHLDHSVFAAELTEREEEVICRHVGFSETGKPESFQETSVALGLSHEAVRSSYWRGIQKLQDNMIKTTNDPSDTNPDE